MHYQGLEKLQNLLLKLADSCKNVFLNPVSFSAYPGLKHFPVVDILKASVTNDFTSCSTVQGFILKNTETTRQLHLISPV